MWPRGFSIVPSCTASPECPLEPSLLHHLLAVRVQRVVDDPLGGIELVIVPVAEPTEPLGDCLEPCGLRLVPERVVRVRAVHDLRKEKECRVRAEPVFL